MEGLLVRVCALCVGSLSLYSSTGAMAVEPPILPKQILVFGGNGMLGGATVERLIPLEHRLVLVNRGTFYWDAAFTVYPYVTHIWCDRWQGLDKCQDLVAHLESTPAIDAVIDFSAYQPEAVRDALDVLKGKAKLYIYVSSDSVYEVCTKSHSEPTLETDAVRPSSPEERESFSAKDAYGHQKLQCEEVLREYREAGRGPPFVSLRLPDVIGPRDNTHRWWTYQLWMKLQPVLETQLTVPLHLATKQLSFVFVDDVADLIFDLVQSCPQAALDQAFNLALAETVNLTALLTDIKEELNLTEFKIPLIDNPHAIAFFPSVQVGPVNISKAETILNWKPTDWKTVVKQTVQFYENAMVEPVFDRVRKLVIRKLQTQFTSKPNDVVNGLIDIYGLKLRRPKDEL